MLAPGGCPGGAPRACAGGNSDGGKGMRVITEACDTFTGGTSSCGLNSWPGGGCGGAVDVGVLPAVAVNGLSPPGTVLDVAAVTAAAVCCFCN